MTWTDGHSGETPTFKVPVLTDDAAPQIRELFIQCLIKHSQIFNFFENSTGVYTSDFSPLAKNRNIHKNIQKNIQKNNHKNNHTDQHKISPPHFNRSHTHTQIHTHTDTHTDTGFLSATSQQNIPRIIGDTTRGGGTSRGGGCISPTIRGPSGNLYLTNLVCHKLYNDFDTLSNKLLSVGATHGLRVEDIELDEEYEYEQNNSYNTDKDTHTHTHTWWYN
eukprot:GHVR01005213.1.p1 GENE.GHVR01005213.1~~GHVR01005213.1.p1  ORF type:complete len:220 (+),score=96.52 GHVR01005213.1:561-1220(+)